jgi:TatD DNase family protein
MIDVHCHLEQNNYDNDRDQVVEKCKMELKAVITSCANPNDFEKTMQIADRYKGFVFASCGIHPEHVKDFSQNQIDGFIETIKQNKDKIVAVGEIGLDYFWVKEPDLQQKQRELFAQLIAMAKEIGKPIVVHTRDAHEDVVRILESEGANEVDMHMFGDHRMAKRVVDNGWFISMNTIVMRSKGHRKIARDCPLERLMLETDAPWLGLDKDGAISSPAEVRNDPTSVKKVAEKIAEIKAVGFEDVWKRCGENAINFFKLPLDMQ